MAETPPAVSNQPPAYRFVPDTTSANAGPSIPEPTGDQLLPFHWAMPLAETPPAIPNQPPAYRVLPFTASAATAPFTPEPNCDQPLPSHCTMPLSTTNPFASKKPMPAYKVLLDTASAVTRPFIPRPSADQLVPSHSAMELAVTSPAIPKSPPAYSVLSDTASARTAPTSEYSSPPPIPAPSADQLVPFHCAISSAETPPAPTKDPPAYKLVPNTARQYTAGPLSSVSPPMPEPSVDQLLPFHSAMQGAETSPAVEKAPPTYKLVPDTANASTYVPLSSMVKPEMPEPSADQLVPSH